MMRRMTAVSALMFAGLWAVSANAAIVITADPADQSAASGATVTVPVYLMETDAETGLIASEGGLVGAAFSAMIISGDSTVSSFLPVPAFDDTTVNMLPGGGLEVLLAVSMGNPTVMPADGMLQLGTLTLHAGNTTTVFHLDDNDFATDGTMTANGTTPTDTYLLGSDMTLQVPEPATMAVLIPVSLALFRRQRVAPSPRG